MSHRPRIAITMGDVAGIGPEIICKLAIDSHLRELCEPVVIGHPVILSNTFRQCNLPMNVVEIQKVDDEFSTNADSISCWNPMVSENADDVCSVTPGTIDGRAGRAAYEYLIHAIHLAKSGSVEAITTAPLNKAALYAGGVCYPGHTEILAEECHVQEFSMMLYLRESEVLQNPYGLAIAHVTLHTSIQSVPQLLTQDNVRETISLMNSFLRRIRIPEPRIGVCALNPHAGESGLFGDEERMIIQPAIEHAKELGLHVEGPHPADTLIRRAVRGEFDGVVAMYHDQGHIPMKLIGFDQAVNITLGLPVIRTSPSHGTAFDIVGQGKADPTGIIEAVRIAALLSESESSFASDFQPSQ